MQQQTFIDANPATGTKGTRITAGYQNNINSELSNILTDLGITPDGSKSNQISEALVANYAKLVSPVFTGTPTVPDVASTGNGQQIVNLESMKAYVTAGQLTFTPVQQGGGSNMGTNHIYLGASSTDALNFVIQADSNDAEYLVLGQDDTNTYGIRRFGYDHTNSVIIATDSNGTTHDLAEENWVTTKLDGYLPLTGGTISGVLNVDEATGINNQINYTQSGKSAWSVGNDNNATTGGNFVISRYDTTGTWDDVPLSIDRTTGIVTINKGISVSGSLSVVGTSSLDNGTITTNGSGVIAAKGVTLPAGSTTGLTVGSASVYQDSIATDNLVLQANGRYAVLDSSGNFTTLNGGLVSSSNVTAASAVISNGGNLITNGPAGTFRNVLFETNGIGRWAINVGTNAETGSNAGSDFNIAASDDSGKFLSTPVTITRSNGQVNINTSLIVPTMASTDNSQNAASTAFVDASINNLSAKKANLTGGNQLSGDQDISLGGLQLVGNTSLGAASYQLTIQRGDACRYAIDYAYDDNNGNYSRCIFYDGDTNSIKDILYYFLDKGRLSSANHGDYTLMSDFGASLGTNGYQKLASGLIMQWGIVTSAGTFNFPITFPNAVFNITAGNHDYMGQYADVAYAWSISTSQFRAGTKAANSGWSSGFAVSWVAFGF